MKVFYQVRVCMYMGKILLRPLELCIGSRMLTFFYRRKYFINAAGKLRLNHLFNQRKIARGIEMLTEFIFIRLFSKRGETTTR